MTSEQCDGRIERGEWYNHSKYGEVVVEDIRETINAVDADGAVNRGPTVFFKTIPNAPFGVGATIPSMDKQQPVEEFLEHVSEEVV